MDNKVLDDIVAFIDKYFVNGNKKQHVSPHHAQWIESEFP